MGNNKTTQILEIFESGEKLTQREIAKKVDCSEGYVSKVKSAHMKAKNTPPETTPETTPETDPTDEEFETETSTFVKKIKVIPDQAVLTENNDEPDTDEEYECGGCGHVWTADKTEYQKACPKCGEEF